MSKKLQPKERREIILKAAIELARRDGYNKITRDNIAKQAGMANGTVTLYFKTMTQLRRALMRAAIAGEVLEIIAQGLAHNDPHATKAPIELQRKAIDSLIQFTG